MALQWNAVATGNRLETAARARQALAAAGAWILDHPVQPHPVSRRGSRGGLGTGQHPGHVHSGRARAARRRAGRAAASLLPLAAITQHNTRFASSQAEWRRALMRRAASIYC